MPRRFPDGLGAYIPTTLARLQRRLPAPGTILTRVGTHVEPDDVIGRCSTQPDPILLHVAAELRIEADDIGRYMRHNAGAHVAFRDIIARRGQHSVVAPMAGVLEAVEPSTGFVTLVPDPIPASVTAMLHGYVIEVEQDCAATIETPAAMFQGAVGWGEEQWGTVRALAQHPDQQIDAAHIDDGCAFAILIGGAALTLDALRAARREQVKAIITGSIDINVVRAFWGERWTEYWQQVQTPTNAVPHWNDGPALVLTEGFGQHPMNDRLWGLLTVFDGQGVYVDPTTSLGTLHRRPRIIAPLPYNSVDVEGVAPMLERPGATVRLLDPSHLGMTARLDHLEGQGQLPLGVRTATARVTLGDGTQVVVPASALDILE